MFSSEKYSLVSSNSSRDSTDDRERTSFLSQESRIRRLPSSIYLITLLNVLLFVVSASLFGTRYYGLHQLNAALRQASTYSPIHDMLDLRMAPKILNGTLFPRKDEPSVARQMPNPIADAVWEEWEWTRVVPVTADQIRAMGKDPSTAAKLENEDWGLGDDAYASIFDVYHQLHCLNELRRIAYSNYYNSSTAPQHHKQEGEMINIHINHCVDMLMQTIQCSGNVNLITMHWVEQQSFPFPDMSINKQCIDFEYLTQWRLENTLDLDKYRKTMIKKEGVAELPAPDQYYHFFLPGVVNPNHLNGAHPGEDFNL